MIYDCNYCVELNVSSGYMCFPDLSYRFLIVIDMFPTDMFYSRYLVILLLFSRPPILFPISRNTAYSVPIPGKKNTET